MDNLNHEPVKYLVDGLSIGVVVGTLANILPSIAALMTIIWTAIRIWETDTAKRLTGRGWPELQAACSASECAGWPRPEPPCLKLRSER